MNVKKRSYPPHRTAVLDIGSNKCVCLIADIDENQAIEVLGVGHLLSKGFKGGVITDATEAETSIITALHAAEEMADTVIEKVWVSLPLPHIISRQITIELNLTQDAVAERDLQDVLNEAANSVPEDEMALHILPFRFELDGQNSIRDPRGMVGSQLTAHLLLVSAPANLVRNLNHCLHRCHLEVEGFIAAPYASALSCLEEDEKELGVTLIDMGSQTTSYSVFCDGRMVYAGAVGVGGNHITQDVAHGLNTHMPQAERLKTVHGGVIISPADDTVMLEVPQLGSTHQDDVQMEKRSHLNHIIRPRAEEVFEMVRNSLQAANLGKMAGGRMALTGGASQLLGMSELASKMFSKQTRLAAPIQLEGLADATSGPAFSTVIGMLRHVGLCQGKQKWMYLPIHSKLKSRGLKHWLMWFKENF